MDQPQQVITQAINLIKEQTGLVFNQAQAHKIQQPILTLKANRNQKKFTVVYKKHINNNQILGLAVNAIRKLPQKGMIVADYGPYDCPEIKGNEHSFY